MELIGAFDDFVFYNSAVAEICSVFLKELKGLTEIEWLFLIWKNSGLAKVEH